MFCKNCGMKLESGMVFCPNCGSAYTVMQEENPNTKPNTEENLDDDKTLILVEDIKIKEVECDSESKVEENPNTENKEDGIEVEENKVEESTEVAVSGIISTEEIKYCPNCGCVNALNDMFCYTCGHSFESTTTKKGKKWRAKNKGNNKFPKLKNKFSLFAAIIALAALVCLVIIVVSGLIVPKKEPVFYLTDNDIKFALSDKKIYLLGEDTYSDKSDIPETYIRYMDIVLTEDHRYVFIPQEIEGYKYDLYRVPYGKKDAEALKVAKEVTSYTVLSNNSFVFLNSDDKLYLSNIKENNKISSDVEWYCISDDKKYIMWGTIDDSDLYVQDLSMSKDKIKIASEITSHPTYTSDFSKIILRDEDGDLVLYTKFTDKTKIVSPDSDSYDFTYYVNEVDGELVVYYWDYETDNIEASLLLEDDLAESDAAMKEPVIEDYQTTIVKDSFWGPRESIETDPKYYEDYDKYMAKLDRDYMRDFFNSTVEINSANISFFSTTEMESTDIGEVYLEDYRVAEDKLVLLQLDTNSIEKMNIEDIMNMDYTDIEDELKKNLNKGLFINIYDGGTSECVLDCDMEDYGSLGQFNVAKDKTYLTLFERDGDDRTLFEIDSKGAMTSLNDECESIYAVFDSGILYSAAYDDGEVELYLNEDRIDSDVYASNISRWEDGVISYYTDVDENGAGSLWIYDKEKKLVDDDVIAFVKNDDGSIFYLYDYNFKKYEGDLKQYKNGKEKLIDTDVRTLYYYREQ